MDAIPLPFLYGLLALLIVLSGFFSGSETGLMTLNRYRLRHLQRSGHGGAKRAAKLLDRPDRLIGVILFGNNLVNIAAASITTLIGYRLYGDVGVAIATVVLTVIILLFAEVTPKTLAAIHPERIAFPAAYVYGPLLRLFYPVVYIINLLANGLLRLIGVTREQAAEHSLSTEELRTVVSEAGAMLPRRHQKMLLSILDLENVTVEDIMVPRNEIMGIDIEDDWDTILAMLSRNQHTRLPLYRGSIDELVGIVHLRRALGLLADNRLNKDTLLGLAREPYFVPENTALNQQLVNFQKRKRRVGFVVDEYGDIQGLVTLEDILEEIVGEFTSEPAARTKEVARQPDGSYLVEGSINIRSLNKSMQWSLPQSDTGPKTLNGLILEHLENIPETGTGLRIGNYRFEIADTNANAVKTVRIIPPTGKPSRKRSNKEAQ